MKTTYTPPFEQISKYVRIPSDGVFLLGDLQIPELAETLVVFAYDFGESRNHPRARHVAGMMRDRGLATLLCDLITDDEEAENEVTQKYQHDAELLARRLIGVTEWVMSNPDTRHLKIVYFGVCTAGASVLIAAAKMHKKVRAVVCRGGRLDLAVKSAVRVRCPALLIVGGDDTVGIELCRETLARLTGEKRLVVVPGATHLFGEPGTLQEMARISAGWIHDLGVAGQDSSSRRRSA
jgi:putative phosphoribosyl transferase